MSDIEQALDLAVIVVRSGGSTALADRTFRNVLRGCGQSDIATVWRMDLVGAHGVADGRPSTTLRPVGSVGVNLARASAAAALGERVARGDLAASALGVEIARLDALPPTYGRWSMVAAAALTAAFFSRITPGDWGAFGVTFVAAGAGQILRSALQRMKLPAGPATLITGMLSASIAAAGLRLGLSHTPSATLVSSVIYMVPGLSLINGFLDIVSQKYLLVGCERLLDALYVFLALVIAIAFASTVIL